MFVISLSLSLSLSFSLPLSLSFSLSLSLSLSVSLHTLIDHACQMLLRERHLSQSSRQSLIHAWLLIAMWPSGDLSYPPPYTLVYHFYSCLYTVQTIKILVLLLNLQLFWSPNVSLYQVYWVYCYSNSSYLHVDHLWMVDVRGSISGQSTVISVLVW